MASTKGVRSASRKPTGASVTTTACTCKYLERASDEPEVPIVFDAEMNEYHLTNVGKNRGHTMIYHCPWCGGAAPRSKRGTFFATISQREEERLRRRTSGLMTVSAVVKKFGKPDADLDEGIVLKTPESKEKPPTIKSYRSIVYERLSETADVRFTDYGPDGGLRVTFQGKYLGRRGS
jgi:hypothetical protein